MSSFKRKGVSGRAFNPNGTRAIPGPVSTFVTSTGVPSLDDILGGGLPLTSSLLVLAPDLHTAYGELIQKYIIAQGLACGHTVCVVDDHARDFASECMWMPDQARTAQATTNALGHEEEEEELSKAHDTKIKIAWRYEQMKQFQTTVSSVPQNEDFSQVFDLTSRIPLQVLQSEQLVPLSVSAQTGESSVRSVLGTIRNFLQKEEPNPAKPVRICIPGLGTYQWGDIEPEDICYFLHILRSIIRAYPYACLSVSLAPHICTDTWGGAGWIQKLGWLSDACISLSAFTINPSLSAMFPSVHGFVHIHTLPAPYTLQSPSDKFSTLRGLSSSGENNLAFKCMRKRLIFETLHLDLEGGVGERRTTPSTTAVALEEAIHAQPSEGVAKVQVQLEDIQEDVKKAKIQEDRVSQTVTTAPPSAFKKTKPKKKVAFHSDRPDLYDF